MNCQVRRLGTITKEPCRPQSHSHDHKQWSNNLEQLPIPKHPFFSGGWVLG